MSDLSRVEQLLRNALGEDIYNVTPQSRVEVLLAELNETIENMVVDDPEAIRRIVETWLEEHPEVVESILEDELDEKEDKLVKTYTVLMDSVVKTANGDGISHPYATWPNVAINERYSYRVVFDGSTYETSVAICVNKDTETWKGISFIGNVRLYGDGLGAIEDFDGMSSMPFCLYYNSALDPGLFIITETEGDHSVKIERLSYSKPKLPNTLIWGDDEAPIRKQYINSSYMSVSVGRNRLEKRASMAFGFANECDKEFSYALGYGNKVDGIYAVGIGTKNTSSGSNSTAIGYKTQATGPVSYAEGFGAQATAQDTHAEGRDTVASGQGAHAEGRDTVASGYISHAEGSGSVASGYISHAEGIGTKSTNNGSHAEGGITEANGVASHAEGQKTIANGWGQHVQGLLNIADDENKYAHIVGNGDINTGERSNAHTLDWNGNAWYAGNIHAAGGAMKLGTGVDEVALSANQLKSLLGGDDIRNLLNGSGISSKTYTPLFGGEFTVTTSAQSGYSNPVAIVTAESPSFPRNKKYRVTINGQEHELPGRRWQNVEYAQGVHSDYIYLGAIGVEKTTAAHVMGDANVAFCIRANAGANQLVISTNVSGTYTILIELIEENYVKLPNELIHGTPQPIISVEDRDNPNYSLCGLNTMSSYGSIAIGDNNVVSGEYSTVLGYTSLASARGAKVLGEYNQATGMYSCAIGSMSVSSGDSSVAIGYECTASGRLAVASGTQTTASGEGSHAEGSGTIASGTASHAEGQETTSSSYMSHSEGFNTVASGGCSHAEGLGTIANHGSQHVFGDYNVADASTAAPHAHGKYVEIVGNGSSKTQRSNARTLDWSGNESLAGGITLGMGTADEVTLTAAQLKQLLALLS